MNEGEGKNVAKLKADDAPWDIRRSPSLGQLIRAYPQALTYIREHGMYAVPESIDVWEYRDLLHRLDPICLRGLRSQGAMSSAELAAWINHRKLLRTNPSKTGIVRITGDTVAAWIELAWRRGAVAVWAGETAGVPPSADTRWVSAETGGSAFSSRLTAAVLRVPGGVIGFLFGGGGIAAAYAWLQAHPTAFSILIAAVGLAAYAGLILLLGYYFKRSFGPSGAVVVIETLRCGGRSLPVSLSG